MLNGDIVFQPRKIQRSGIWAAVAGHAHLTTVFVRQGHYAHDPLASAVDPAPDLSLERIEDLIPIKPLTSRCHYDHHETVA